MKIAIVAAQEALPLIKKSFEAQRCVGVEFEYYADVNEVLTAIETRGFYLDKLVLVASFLQNWGPIDRQTLINRLLAICEHLSTTAEIYLADSKQILRSEYSNLLSVYPQVKYQSQQLHVSELFGLVMGDIKQEAAENIDESVKPRGFFSRKFGKKNTQQQPEITDDTALVSDAEMQQGPQEPYMPQQDVASEEPEDLYNLFEEPQGQQPMMPQQNFVSDAPLFEDTIPAPTDQGQFEYQQADDMSIPGSNIPPMEEPQVPQDFAPLYEEDNTQFTPPPQPQPAFIPPPQPAPAPQPPVRQQPAPKPVRTKSSYVDIFQKRTKIILCTGDRRSGTSTAMSNLAQQAVNDGLAVLVMDLDYERKGQAINFPFEADENDTQLAFSLFRAASAPTNIADYVIHLEDGLDFIGTAISVSEVNNVHKAVTDDILKQMLSSALSSYDLIFIDCPFEYLREYTSLISMSHIILHSMMTDYRSILNTLNSLTPDDFENDMAYNLYLSKAMLLLNNFTSHFWNSTEINEKTVTSYMCALTGEDFYRGVDVVGRIPYFQDYDRYMDAGALFVSDKKYKGIFIQLLNDLAVRG